MEKPDGVLMFPCRKVDNAADFLAVLCKITNIWQIQLGQINSQYYCIKNGAALRMSSSIKMMKVIQLNKKQ